jgi:hypothetical protein
MKVPIQLVELPELGFDPGIALVGDSDDGRLSAEESTPEQTGQDKRHHTLHSIERAAGDGP